MTAEPVSLSDVSPQRKSRSWPVVVAVAVCIGLVVGGAAWFAHSWLARGPQPAEVLPVSTLAYISVDLDPAGDQKLKAVEAFGKFPALGGSGDDLEIDDVRRKLVEGLAHDACDELKYSEVKGWLGDRLALAVVDQEEPEPVLVLQVDGDGASDGLKSVATCFGKEGGFARTGEWAVVARTKAVAEKVIEDAEKAPLSDDADFQEWTGAAGDPGVVTLYVAPAAGDALLAYADENPEMGWMLMTMPTTIDPVMALGPMAFGMFAMAVPEFDGGYEEGFEEGFEPRPSETDWPAREPGDLVHPGMPGYPFPDEPSDQVLDAMSEKELDAFFAERFQPKVVGEDGELREMTPAEKAREDRRQQRIQEKFDREYEEFDEEDEDFAFGAPEIPDEVRKSIADFSGLGGVVRFHDGALELELVSDRIAGSTADLTGGQGGAAQMGELPASVTAAYGVSLADDFGSQFLQMLQQQWSFFPGQEAVKEFEKSTGLDLPADLGGLGGGSLTVVVGDPRTFESNPGDAEVAVRLVGETAAIEASLTKLLTKVPDLESRRDGGTVLVGLNAAWLDELADASGLDETERYRDVLPDAEKADMVFFLDFDIHDWIVETTPKSDKGDVRPLDSLGISRSSEDGVDRTLVRLTLD